MGQIKDRTRKIKGLHPHQEQILKATQTSRILKVESLQELWSGYGEIQRIFLEGNPKITSIIAKIIEKPTEQKHPRGWNSEIGNQRKLKSYRIEENWYQKIGNLKTLGKKRKARIPNYYPLKIGPKPAKVLETQNN